MTRSELRFRGCWLWLALLPGMIQAEPTGYLGLADWKTPYYVRTGALAGPTVLIISGLHGDELAGPLAADQIRAWPLRRGTLILLPRANQPALRVQKRLTPGEPGEAGNLNRAFPPGERANSPMAQFAAALWDFIRERRPDWLLDLHEGSDFRIQTNRSVGNSFILSAQPETRRLGEILLTNLNATIPDTNRHFVTLRLGFTNTLARAAADHLGIRTMIVETTIRGQPLALRTRQHRLVVHRLLRELNMLAEDLTPGRMMDDRGAAGRLKVAVYDGAGAAGRGIPNVLAHLGKQTNVLAGRVAPEDIRAGALSQFDVVFFTGGSGSGQANALGETGRARSAPLSSRAAAMWASAPAPIWPAPGFPGAWEFWTRKPCRPNGSAVKGGCKWN